MRISRSACHLGLIAIATSLTVTACQRNPDATPAAKTPPMHAVESTDIKDSAASAASALKVTVSLSPKLAKQAAPEDVVFIFARAASGPRMPLAIVRKQVKDLPITVVLDDSQSMNPQAKLSSAAEVVVVARVTKSGMADVQDGDLEGSVTVASGTKNVSISIDKILTGQKTPAAIPGHR